MTKQKVGEAPLSSPAYEEAPGNVDEVVHEALQDNVASRVINVLHETGLYTEGLSDAIGLLGMLRNAERELISPETTTTEEADKLRLLLPEHDERWWYALGIGLSVTENERQEKKRLDQTANDMLEAIYSNEETEVMGMPEDTCGPAEIGTNGNIASDDILQLAILIAGGTPDKIPLDAINKFMPIPSAKDIAAVRDLVNKTDIEGFLINSVKNVVTVEDGSLPLHLRLRAAYNIELTLAPVLRLYGENFDKLRKRAREGAAELLAISDSETNVQAEKWRDFAERVRPKLRLVVEQLISENGSIIREGVKSRAEMKIKAAKKGLSEIKYLPDILRFRVEVESRERMLALAADIIEKFENAKHHRLEVKGSSGYKISLGRTQDPNRTKLPDPDEDFPIILDIANAKELWLQLNCPNNVKHKKAKDSGFQAAHINFIYEGRGDLGPLNFELQIVTSKMRERNEHGESAAGIYKIPRDPESDISPILEMLGYIQKRAAEFHDGYKLLGLNTQIKLLELMPTWQTDLSRLYAPVRVQDKLFALQREIAHVVSAGDFSEELLQEEFSMLVAPVSNIDIDTFKRILTSLEPELVVEGSKLLEAVLLFSDWHKDDFRRDKSKHFEGHVLPAALTYLMNSYIRGNKIWEEALIAFLGHDVIEDAKTPQIRDYRKQQIRQLFGPTVYDIIIALSKDEELRKSAADIEKAGRLARPGPLKDTLAEMQATDRFANLNTDMVVAVGVKKWLKRYSTYFGTTSHYKELFESNQQAWIMWLYCRDVCTAVKSKIQSNV